jgi:hypothetical protein
MPDSTAGQVIDATRYAYKTSLVGAMSEFALQSDAIEWNRAGSVVRVPYADIRRVRLSFRPMTMQSYRFIAEIWAMGGKKLTIASCSMRSMFEQTRQDAEYNAFMTELHQRLLPSGAATRFQTGSPFLLYWLGVAVIAALCLAAAMLIVRSLEAEAWPAAAFIAGLLAVFLWQTGGFLRRNKPDTYTPEQVPSRVLP